MKGERGGGQKSLGMGGTEAPFAHRIRGRMALYMEEKGWVKAQRWELLAGRKDGRTGQGEA